MRIVAGEAVWENVLMKSALSEESDHPVHLVYFTVSHDSFSGQQRPRLDCANAWLIWVLVVRIRDNSTYVMLIIILLHKKQCLTLLTAVH